MNVTSTTYEPNFLSGSLRVPVDKPTKEELEYWEKVLKYHGLGMERGSTLGGKKFVPLRDSDAPEEPKVRG